MNFLDMINLSPEDKTILITTTMESRNRRIPFMITMKKMASLITALPKIRMILVLRLGMRKRITIAKNKKILTQRKGGMKSLNTIRMVSLIKNIVISGPGRKNILIVGAVALK